MTYNNPLFEQTKRTIRKSSFTTCGIDMQLLKTLEQSLIFEEGTSPQSPVDVYSPIDLILDSKTSDKVKIYAEAFNAAYKVHQNRKTGSSENFPEPQNLKMGLEIKLQEYISQYQQLGRLSDYVGVYVNKETNRINLYLKHGINPTSAEKNQLFDLQERIRNMFN